MRKELVVGQVAPNFNARYLLEEPLWLRGS
jgi:hypothetical protein